MQADIIDCLATNNTLPNNASMVPKITYGTQSFLFMGDAEGKDRSDEGGAGLATRDAVNGDDVVLRTNGHGFSAWKAWTPLINIPKTQQESLPGETGGNSLCFSLLKTPFGI